MIVFYHNSKAYLGGNIAFSVSSVWFLLRSLETGGSLLPFGGVGTGLVVPSGCCGDAFNGRDWKRWKIILIASSYCAHWKEGTLRLC